MASEWFVLSGAVPAYCRGNTKYSVRRVMDPSGTSRYTKRWALFNGRQRVWELQAMPDAGGAILQAEGWLKEHELLRRYHQ